MNVLCVSYYDNGGQMQQLANALNKYTEHDAKHMSFEKTYLEYDIDINAYYYRNEQLQQMLSDRNFFIFSEYIPARFGKLGIGLSRSNMIIRCFGTVVRDRVDLYRYMWNKEFIIYTSGGFDPTIHPKLGFCAYHIPNLYDFSQFPDINRKLPIKICHAPTNPKVKSTKLINEVVNRLEKEYGIEHITIHDVSWKDALELKASCHITIDQFRLGTYASSAIESMYLKHTVVSRISPFVMSMHPDLPIIHADGDSLYEELVYLIEHEDYIKQMGERGHEYAVREHGAENVVKWDHLIKWVAEGFN